MEVPFSKMRWQTAYPIRCIAVRGKPDDYFEHEDFQKVFDFNTRQEQ